ncbi:hypothetical protein N7472_004939 [Penicillium cf. griseofulvum]|uniref:Uncharacterized protein n=1 Tax=Penicillium cf. griseofulvum TaxID=2972120 RepID=A0A9W9MEQ2_9EURO|nr:hypothetical protein N7472_004939 [Penicillium cf. griseofulvum]
MRILELSVLALATLASGLNVHRNHQFTTRAAPVGDAWKTLQCSQVQGEPDQQWEAAGAKAAWDTTISAWKQDPRGSLSQFFSTYLHGPDHMRCNDIATENRCSQPVECEDATIPAGALILNGFAGVHQLHGSAFQAIENVQADVSNVIGSFTSQFAPKPDDKGKVLKNIFDASALIIALGSSVVFNYILKELEHVVMKSIMYDTIAASMGAIGSFYKTNMKGAIEGLQVQNTVDSFLGETMKGWKNLESSYLQNLFSENADTDSLYSLINNGTMGAIMDNLDLSSTSQDVQKILFGQMIPFAWSASLDEVNVCYDGKLHYLLNAHGTDKHSLIALPGGDHVTLDGTSWGGITIEDIVISSIDGFKQNNNANGYSRPDVNTIVTSFGGQVPGVRTPGFFNLPVCTDTTSFLEALDDGDGNSPYWPCSNPEGYTSSGTNIHITRGCVVINDSKRCETFDGTYNVKDQENDHSTATIYSKFDGDDTLHSRVTPGCKLEASWPRGYGDLDFADDCLKDRSGQYAQCCDDSTTTNDVVINPYAT